MCVCVCVSVRGAGAGGRGRGAMGTDLAPLHITITDVYDHKLSHSGNLRLLVSQLFQSH